MQGPRTRWSRRRTSTIVFVLQSSPESVIACRGQNFAKGAYVVYRITNFQPAISPRRSKQRNKTPNRKAAGCILLTLTPTVQINFVS
jgi:hypothetical protein